MAVGLFDLLTDVPTGVELPCQAEPELFFAEAPADLELAKGLCADCAIRAECLTGALDRAEPHGVWGGQIFDNGVVIARKRPRGRPPKNSTDQVPAQVTAA